MEGGALVLADQVTCACEDVTNEKQFDFPLKMSMKTRSEKMIPLRHLVV